MFCLRTRKRVSLGELIYHRIYTFYAMVYDFFRVYYIGLEYFFRVFSSSSTFWRILVILEPFEVQNCTDA